MFRSILGLGATLLAAASVQAASVQAPPPPVEDYGKLPGIGLVRLSPSGARYALVADVNGLRRVLVFTTQNTLLISMPIDKVKIRDLEWAGDDHLLITTSATVNIGIDYINSKSELYSVSVLNIQTKKTFEIFRNSYNMGVANVVAGAYGTAQIGGRWYGYFGDYTYDSSGHLKTDDDGLLYPDLYRVDLDTGKIELAALGRSDLTGWLVGPDGVVQTRSFYTEKTGDWRIVSDKHGHVTLASGRDPLYGAGVMGFGKTADSVIIETPGPDGMIDQEIPLAGGEAKEIPNDATVANELIDPVTGLWIGVIQENGDQDAVLFDPLREAKWRGAKKAFPGYIVRLQSYSADFNHVIVETEGGDDSGTYWLINFSDAKGAASIVGMGYPTVLPNFVGPVRMIDYKAADGLAMQGVLTLPPGRSPKDLPVVVMPHGGPVARDYPGFNYWAQAFAARGYAVFQPNFRGSDGYGAAFRDAGNGQWGRKMQTDISDGLAELVRQGIVDPKRACIAGWSYGGYAALAGVTVQQHLYRCAVSMAGVADLGLFLTNKTADSGALSSTTRFWRKFMGVTSDWTYSQILDVSPVKLADRADAPILLIHGDNDTTVPIDQSQAMDRALKAAGKPVEFITLPGADHGLLEQDARVAMLKASVAFVMKYDPPDPAPADVAAK